MRIDFERTLEEFRGICENGDAESVGISARSLIFITGIMESNYPDLLPLEEFRSVIGEVYSHLERFSGGRIDEVRGCLRRYLIGLGRKSSRTEYSGSVPGHVRDGLGLRAVA